MTRIIIAQWENGTLEAFTSITKFIKAHNNYSYDTLYTHLTRKKKVFVDEFVTVSRIEINKPLTIQKS